MNCDYAKTLYKPTRPDWVDDFLGKYTRKKVPYFFQEAKGKEKHQVSPITESLVNQLRGLIKNKRISYHKLAPFDYTLLMSDRTLDYCDPKLAMIYDSLAQQYHFKLAHTYDEDETNISYIVNLCHQALTESGLTIEQMADQLVYYLFNKRSKKSLLWCCFGDILLENLKNNLDRHTRCCRKCGQRFKPYTNRQRYCSSCAIEMKRENARLRKRRQRERERVL